MLVFSSHAVIPRKMDKNGGWHAFSTWHSRHMTRKNECNDTRDVTRYAKLHHQAENKVTSRRNEAHIILPVCNSVCDRTIQKRGENEITDAHGQHLCRDTTVWNYLRRPHLLIIASSGHVQTRLHCHHSNTNENSWRPLMLANQGFM